MFHVLRNARVLERKIKPNLAVCWGGHSINDVEYQYTKKVGYELGLRGIDVCTGCGPGAMKGPMKGATIGHAKQRITTGRYIGITEPGIIAAEPPNAIVNQLVIMPDIEKRLEAFVRLAHGVVVFPGGAGTTEEILYLLGVLLDPRNAEQRAADGAHRPGAERGVLRADPPVHRRRAGHGAGRKGERSSSATRRLWRANGRGHSPMCAASAAPATTPTTSTGCCTSRRTFQHPFDVTHESMRALELHRDQPRHELAANLRRAFSGIVAGNVKEQGIAAIEEHGPFELRGDAG